ARLVELRRDVDNFRDTVFEILETDSSRWLQEARTLIRQQIMPKREGAIRAAEEMQALNRRAFVQQQNEIAGLYRMTQQRLWQSFGFAVFASLGIALLSAIYAGRLEDRVQRQRQKEQETARDLQRLSTQLVTAQEEERRNIARELHDEIGQALTALKVELAVVQHVVGAAGVPVDRLDSVRAIADNALHTVRDLSRLLHPALLDDLGLAAAVDAYLKGFGARDGVKVDLRTERLDERLTPDVEAAAYRIVQEALTNVARHARATSCRVYLQRLTHTLLVTVEDNGVGFDPAELRDSGVTRGLGLIGIRERVAQFHGTIRIESAPGKGTRLTVELRAQSRPLTDVAPEESTHAVPATEVSGG
ncbi:MAG: sensor histidine kinase, partial [Acidobacteria bacterium]|nr:sensor histidine kinase [Acidobacteriota bacterium]